MTKPKTRSASRSFTDEFKDDAVRLATSGYSSIEQTARIFGIGNSRLRAWIGTAPRADKTLTPDESFLFVRRIELICDETDRRWLAARDARDARAATTAARDAYVAARYLSSAAERLREATASESDQSVHSRARAEWLEAIRRESFARRACHVHETGGMRDGAFASLLDARDEVRHASADLVRTSNWMLECMRLGNPNDKRADSNFDRARRRLENAQTAVNEAARRVKESDRDAVAAFDLEQASRDAINARWLAATPEADNFAQAFYNLGEVTCLSEFGLDGHERARDFRREASIQAWALLPLLNLALDVDRGQKFAALSNLALTAAESLADRSILNSELISREAHHYSCAARDALRSALEIAEGLIRGYEP